MIFTSPDDRKQALEKEFVKMLKEETL